MNYHTSQRMRRVAITLGLLAGLSVSQTAFALDFNGVYSESFNTMGTSGTTPPTGWSVKTGNSGSSNTTWTTAIIGSGANSVASMVATSASLTASSAPTAANVNGYNAQGASSADRVLATSPTSISGSALELSLTNTSGAEITGLQLGYDIRRYTAPATANELPGYWLFYSLDNGNTWTNVSTLNPAVSGSGILVPNTTGVTTVPGTTFNLDTPWTSGTPLLLRWVDDNATQTSPDQIIGLDNVTITKATNTTQTALFFNGTNQYVTMGSGSALGASNLTLECWLYRTGAGVTTSTGTGGVTAVPLITKGRGEADGNNKDCNYFLGIDATGKLVADFEAQAGATGITAGQNYPVTGTTIIENNRWYHAAATYDTTTATWNLYLDGVLDGTKNNPAGAAPRNDSIQHFGIGTAMTSTGAAAGYFQGVIDEVRVWNVARSATDIAASRDVPVTSPATGLLVVYGLNEGTGTVVSAIPGTAPAGSLMNSPFWVDGAFSSSNSAPTITLTSPATGLTLYALAAVTLTASAADSDGSIAKVEFLRNNQVIATDTEAPYEVTDSNLPVGVYSYTARATDSEGAVRNSAAAAVSVSFDPLNHPANTALLFDGSDDYVTMGVAPELAVGGTPGNGLTVEAWFRKEGTGITASSGSGGVTAVPLVAKGRGESDGSNLDCNYLFGINSAGKLVADFESYASGQNYPVTGTNTAITDGVWHHAAATFDGSNSVWKLYLDGVEVGSATVPAGTAPRYDSIQHFAIGTALNSSGVREGAFAGRIDEVRVWNYARSASDIAAAKDYELANAAGLVGRYGLNEAVGSTTVNSANSATNSTTPVGTLTNGPLWVEGATFVGVNTAPQVSLQEPATGASAYFPYPVQFSVSASDTDGFVTKVEFFVNDVKAGETTSAPFIFNWTPPTTGAYTVTARATDNLGAGAWSTASALTILPNPNQPPVVTLQKPVNNAMVFGSTAQLDVAIADPEGDATTVTYYGRTTSTSTPGPDFSLVVLPDTQYYSQNTGGTLAQIFKAQTQWIVDNRIAKNIAFVSHMGDITENGENSGNPSEWINADAAMSLLENPVTTQLPYGIPYSIFPGNHDLYPGDQNATGTFYNQYFGVPRFTGRSYYGGHYGSTNNNNYQLFSASGMDFIVINLAFRASADQGILDWADSLLKANPSRRAIVNSHWIINTGNPASFGGQGLAIYDNLKDNPNLFLMLSGHVHGEGQRSDTFEGRTVHTILTDYQALANGGNGFLRILTFKPSTNTIHVESYSPTLNRAVNSSDGVVSWGGSYDLPYTMSGMVSNWTTLGSVTTPVGANQASLSWNGLMADTPYEWYVTANDTINTAIATPGTFVTSPASAQNDISAQVRSTTSAFTYNRATKTYNGNLTVTNTSQSPLSGPFVIWLNNLASGITLANGNGVFNSYPHIDPAAPLLLNPGESTTVALKFSNPSNAKITFTPVVFNGAIGN